jgi:phosphoglycerate dehydrogenase-like enzyme
MPKLLLLAHESKEYLELIQKAELPDLEIFTEFNPECDIIFGDTKSIQDALPNLPNLNWVQTTSAGVERLMDTSLRRDYTLTNARNVFGASMSEYVFGYLLYFKKRIAERITAQQSKQWDDFDEGILRGKTIGLLGVGSIGAHLAMTAKHFGMKVRGFTRASEDCKDVDIYYHPSSQPSPSGRGGIISFADGLDYLVSVLPRTESTNEIVNAELFNALPNHAIFINVGRGNALDNTALTDALNNKKIAAAVLDVTSPEPLPEDHPFWTTSNLLLTFHTSAMSYPEDMVNLFVENYRLYIEGKPLNHQVDFERGY